MRVIIAGYNIDSSLIASLSDPAATPEVISAAYARISRSSKSVDALRAEAKGEVAKARASNQSIIFGMGHASVAEHAVFNIDLIGISRHLTEAVQRSRLASFTEKSQRYVTFNRDYVVPAELDAHPNLKTSYIDLCDRLFAEYKATLEALKAHIAAQEPDLTQRELDGRAKEDARYILPLATRTQMGMTINARSLETLLRRLSADPAREAMQLRDLLLDKVLAITPSLVRYTQKGSFTGRIAPGALPGMAFSARQVPENNPPVRLISLTPNAEDQILAAILFEQGYAEPDATQKWLADLDDSIKAGMWDSLYRGIDPWQKLPRAFECSEANFLLRMSECCWGQFKRHRSATLLRCPTAGASPDLIIPPAVSAIGREQVWRALHAETISWANSVPAPLKHIRPYLHLNATVMNVSVRMNLRELHHFVRLRSDLHAQWEIRALSDAMADLVKPLAPNATRYLCGKSQFPADQPVNTRHLHQP